MAFANRFARIVNILVIKSSNYLALLKIRKINVFLMIKIFVYNFILLANNVVLTIPKTTTVTELNGIKIAAITGSNNP